MVVSSWNVVWLWSALLLPRRFFNGRKVPVTWTCALWFVIGCQWCWRCLVLLHAVRLKNYDRCVRNTDVLLLILFVLMKCEITANQVTTPQSHAGCLKLVCAACIQQVYYSNSICISCHCVSLYGLRSYLVNHVEQDAFMSREVSFSPRLRAAPVDGWLLLVRGVIWRTRAEVSADLRRYNRCL